MTTARTLILLGGGGHAAVVADAARAAGWTVAGYLDDAHDAMDAPDEALGLVRLGTIDRLPDTLDGRSFHVAIGDGAVRERTLDRTGPLTGGAAPATIVHPTAVVSPSAHLGAGVFVGPLAVINARTRVERGAIVNTGAIVEHDCVVGAFGHVAPGAVLAGSVHLGLHVLVGVGASVRPGVRIGPGAVLGAGAVAVTDIPAGGRCAGVHVRFRPVRLKVHPDSSDDRGMPHARTCSRLWLLIALAGSTFLVACEPEEMAISETAVRVLQDRPGRGKAAKAGDIVCIDFSVFVPDPKDRRRVPDGEEVLFGENFCFKLGAEAVIAGFDDAVPGMSTGGMRIVHCPPHKHWGSGGYGGKIPENVPLIFHIKLVSIEQ